MLYSAIRIRTSKRIETEEVSTLLGLNRPRSAHQLKALGFTRSVNGAVRVLSVLLNYLVCSVQHMPRYECERAQTQVTAVTYTLSGGLSLAAPLQRDGKGLEPAVLLSPGTLSRSVNHLLHQYQRYDVLEYSAKRRIRICEWNIQRGEID
jgi:hypothetical protein